MHCSYKERFFCIELETDLKPICYIIAKSSFQYCCIYDTAAEKQIVLIETYLTAVDLKYTHKVYILGEYKEIANVLSFFTVYYSNNEFSGRFHMSDGTVHEKSWNFSKYINKYDPSRRENNFPDENYFGKTIF